MELLKKLEEPQLRFGFDQPLDDPRDGLALFGPLDRAAPYGIRAGVIGTDQGVERFTRWLSKIQGPVADDPASPARPLFPGFEAAFRTAWPADPVATLGIDSARLAEAIHIDDGHQRVFEAASLYVDPISRFLRTEEPVVDVWFVIEPDDVYRFGRPQSVVPSSERVSAAPGMNVSRANRLRSQYSLFTEDHAAAEPYYHEVNFHHQLKARLLGHGAVIQIIRESTLAYQDVTDRLGRPTRQLAPLQSAIAWNLSTTAFYKAGGRPWKLASVREGVCYLGLVFKRDSTAADPRIACCAAQMFLDSGDGVVFKGAVGPWYSPDSRDYHLTEQAASELIQMAMNSYEERVGRAPREFFIHGKVRFNEEEWRGFTAVAEAGTRLVGVRIRETDDIRLYRMGRHPALRGLAYIRDPRTAYLWTRGFIPRLRTYPGREVPRPLLVDVARGQADIETVLADILALTKLNYNACIYGDGVPVTLKFADAVGEILTAGPIGAVPPLPFKFYI